MSAEGASKAKYTWLIVGLIIGIIIGIPIAYFVAPAKVVEKTVPPKAEELTIVVPTWITPDHWYWTNVLAPEFEGLMARKGVYVGTTIVSSSALGGTVFSTTFAGATK